MPPPLPVPSIETMRLAPPPLPVFAPSVMTASTRVALRAARGEDIPDFLNGAARRKRIGMVLLGIAGLALLTVFFCAFLSNLQPR